MSRRQVRNLKAPTFGQRVREARKLADLSQEGLAREVGVTLRTIQRWEADETKLKYGDVLALADALNVSPSDLYETKEAA